MELTTTPTALENAAYIRRTIPEIDLYNQLAEEASELSQAANKMVRSLRGVNPTPKTRTEIMNDIIEEYTDILNVAVNILGLQPDQLIGDYKLYRWRKRLENGEPADI